MPLQKAKIVKKKQLTKDVIELDLLAETNFDYKSGQYISIKVTDKNSAPCIRAYSIASAPQKDRKSFSLCVKIIEGGRASNWFSSLKENDTIEFLGPFGEFVFTTPKNKEVVFVGTGTGIAPLKAILEETLSQKTTQKIHLIFGLRHVKDIFYKEIFENMAKNHPNFTFTFTLSKPENNSYKGLSGRVTPIVEKLEFSAKNTEFYICGLTDMVEDVTKVLKTKNVPEENVHLEKYN